MILSQHVSGVYKLVIIMCIKDGVNLIMAILFTIFIKVFNVTYIKLSIYSIFHKKCVFPGHYYIIVSHRFYEMNKVKRCKISKCLLREPDSAQYSESCCKLPEHYANYSHIAYIVDAADKLNRNKLDRSRKTKPNNYKNITL